MNLDLGSLIVPTALISTVSDGNDSDDGNLWDKPVFDHRDHMKMHDMCMTDML